MENKLSKFITGFTKLHETQHYMVTMLEKWRKDIYKKGSICFIFVDLSKKSITIFC